MHRVTVFLAGVPEGGEHLPEIKHAQDRFIARLKRSGWRPRVVMRFTHAPSMIMEVDDALLAHLEQRRDVKQVQKDFIVKTQ